MRLIAAISQTPSQFLILAYSSEYRRWRESDEMSGPWATGELKSWYASIRDWKLWVYISVHNLITSGAKCQMASQLWLFLTIWRENKASISPISILTTWNLEIMLDSCKITTKMLWKCFKMLKWGEMRHINDQYCPKLLLYGCIKLFVPEYDFFYDWNYFVLIFF